MTKARLLLFVTLFVPAFTQQVHAQVAPTVVHDPTAVATMLANSAQEITALGESTAQQIKIYTSMVEEAKRSVQRMTQFPAEIINTAVFFYEQQARNLREIEGSLTKLQREITDTFESPEDFFITDNDFQKWLDPNLTDEETAELVKRDLERVSVLRKNIQTQAWEFRVFSEASKKRMEDGHEKIASVMQRFVGNESIQQALTALAEMAAGTYVLIADLVTSMNKLGDAVTTDNYMNSTNFNNDIISQTIHQVQNLEEDEFWGYSGPEKLNPFSDEYIKERYNEARRPIEEQEMYLRDQKRLEEMKRR